MDGCGRVNGWMGVGVWMDRCEYSWRCECIFFTFFPFFSPFQLSLSSLSYSISLPLFLGVHDNVLITLLKDEIEDSQVFVSVYNMAPVDAPAASPKGELSFFFTVTHHFSHSPLSFYHFIFPFSISLSLSLPQFNTRTCRPREVCGVRQNRLSCGESQCQRENHA